MCAAGTSGVIAVVIYGLYGSANSKWNMSSAVVESPAFDTFWDTISFMLNGIVFFFAGASSVNFFWRSSEVCFCAFEFATSQWSTPTDTSWCQHHRAQPES